MDENCEAIYASNSIYTIGYPNGEEVKVSYGKINRLELKNQFGFSHLCSTQGGSSGSPILSLKNNKVIGIHKESSKQFNYNNGSFLKLSIKEFISKNINNNTNSTNMNNNKNNNIKKNYNLYNGFIFDYSKKYKEPDFLSPILIENHSFYCSGGLFLDYENKEIIKSKNYSFKDEFPNNFDEIENNFKEIFEELKVDPSKHYVILTDSLINFNNKNKEYKKKCPK